MNRIIALILMLLGAVVCFGSNYLAYLWCRITKQSYVREGVMVTFKLISFAIVLFGLMVLFAQ